jgi:hypothetical protein
MYCPNCATKLSDNQKFCRSCGLDLQILSQVFTVESKALESQGNVGSRSRKAKLRIQGTITLMTALLVGCLIPISVGLFSGSESLKHLILVLSGLAGLILFAGIIMLIYADHLPVEVTFERQSRGAPLGHSVPTNELPPADPSETITSVAERTTDLLNASLDKSTRKQS